MIAIGRAFRYVTSSAPIIRQASSNDGIQLNISQALQAICPTLDEIDPRDKPHVQVMTPINQLPILHIKATHNNTMITITDHTGRTVAWTSAGAEGFKNARRGTTFAAQSTGTSAGLKSISLGYQRVKVQLKGMGPGRHYSLKGLQASGIDVAIIQDVTPIPHNGCKPRKAKRL